MSGFMIVSALLLLAGNSCDIEPPAIVDGSTAQMSTPSPVRPAAVASPLQEAVEKICRGQFEQAEQLLASEDGSPAAAQLQHLLSQHQQLQRSREQEKLAAYQEQVGELQQIKDETAAKQVLDVNDLDEIMLTVVRAKEYAQDDQKAELLNDPFVQKTLAQMQKKSDEYELQGKWLDAYAHNYYWLTALHEDEQSYKDKAEELTELATIELSLQDSSCGETAQERYEGIEVAMFFRALQLLDNNYVSVVDYGEMAKKGLRRCLLLGTVLRQTNEKLAWTTTAEAAENWAAGLNAMTSAIEDDIAKGQELKAESIAGLLQDIMAMSDETIRLPKEVLIAQFTEASFAALDPFTNLIWPWNVKDFEKSMTQKFTGIGVEISKSTGVLRVVSLLPDKPAYRSGKIDADDEIIAVNGEPTDDMTTYCAVGKITGPKGTKVQLTMRRPSTDKVWDVSLMRDEIVVAPLRGWTRTAEGEWDYMVDPENAIGYVRLTSFTENTGPDLDSVLKKLERKGLNGLILDLRFNTGGYLQAAADVVDMFVTEGVIVKSNPRQGFATYEIAHRSGTHPNYPLVVLINGSSASASEIVAGALQDPKYQRATLVGHRSYGKGSVQVVTGYTGDGSQMKYTVAYYHLPSDQRVKNRYQIEKLGRKDWGIAPDVEVNLLSNETKKMIDIQRDNDILFRGDHKENADETKRHALSEAIDGDPQLATGIMVVRSKLLSQGMPLVLNETDEQRTQTVSAESNKAL